MTLHTQQKRHIARPQVSHGVGGGGGGGAEQESDGNLPGLMESNIPSQRQGSRSTDRVACIYIFIFLHYDCNMHNAVSTARP